MYVCVWVFVFPVEWSNGAKNPPEVGGSRILHRKKSDPYLLHIMLHFQITLCVHNKVARRQQQAPPTTHTHTHTVGSNFFCLHWHALGECFVVWVKCIYKLWWSAPKSVTNVVTSCALLQCDFVGRNRHDRQGVYNMWGGGENFTNRGGSFSGGI